ncbi:unnamed protein product [Linum tenue]|uniref:Secreted protein n=1 Tax=Linum tenue TaxID=586396 RepID=A0AAV0MFC3_9ROSI|nr:unnamed protein product [Linum tenue]
MSRDPQSLILSSLFCSIARVETLLHLPDAVPLPPAIARVETQRKVAAARQPSPSFRRRDLGLLWSLLAVLRRRHSRTATSAPLRRPLNYVSLLCLSKRRDLRLLIVDVTDEVSLLLLLLLVVGDLRQLKVVVVRLLLFRPGVVVGVQEVDLFNLPKLNRLHQLHRFPPLSIVEVHLSVHLPRLLPRLLMLTRALLIQRQLQETFFTARNG